MNYVTPSLLTTHEAAAILGVSISFLKKRRAKGLEPNYLILGARMVRYSLSDLQEYMDTCAKGTDLFNAKAGQEMALPSDVAEREEDDQYLDSTIIWAIGYALAAESLDFEVKSVVIQPQEMTEGLEKRWTSNISVTPRLSMRDELLVGLAAWVAGTRHQYPKTSPRSYARMLRNDIEQGNLSQAELNGLLGWTTKDLQSAARFIQSAWEDLLEKVPVIKAKALRNAASGN